MVSNNTQLEKRKNHPQRLHYDYFLTIWIFDIVHADAFYSNVNNLVWLQRAIKRYNYAINFVLCVLKLICNKLNGRTKNCDWNLFIFLITVIVEKRNPLGLLGLSFSGIGPRRQRCVMNRIAQIRFLMRTCWVFNL